MTVAAILKHKLRQFGDQPLAAVPPTDTIAEVAKLLSRRRIGAVLVVDAQGQLQGIVSERDIVRCLATRGAAALDHAASQLMTRDVRTATMAMTESQAMEAMSEGHFRHLPVIEAGQLVGIVSIGDIVTARLRDASQELDTLKAYVAGS